MQLKVSENMSVNFVEFLSYMFSPIIDGAKYQLEP